ncbi:sodium:solute symporter family protein [Oleiharenicola lentus]|uniref:sodium:solute symporter family protein n=1 Tax=Oleiharenicola lentus TaxID=2508720 RepID=UPI003F6808D5
MSGLHLLDYAVIAAYFIVVLTLGKIAAKGATTGEGFFLAGRKLGKVSQFFLNFGNSAAASDAVSTASVVYQQGISGIWLGFQMIFLNPYYWFMYPWYRRVRLTTTADIFKDRLGSSGLSVFYATFTIISAVAVTMAFGNLVSYKISSALVTKTETSWSPAERASVEDYRELMTMEGLSKKNELPATERDRLGVLRERQARGELRNFITALEPWSFYLIYTITIGAYIVMGGMAATALNEAFQGVLIIVFSVILIPAGIAAVGSWDELGRVLPAEAFQLFGTGSGTSQFTVWTISAIFLATLMQAHAMPGNMSIASSAKNEFAARFGAVSGTFGKRLVTITWAFCGLIAMALYSGANTLADADMVWGTMSRQLLGPGLLGLMFAGIIASNMSTIAAKAMSVSALFAHNIYKGFRPQATDRNLVTAGRWTLVVVLLVGVVVSTQMTNVYTVLQFAMTINVPFGASLLLMFIWRRVTVAAVWTAVLGSAFLNIIFPLVAEKIPALANNSYLTTRTSDSVGRPTAVFFESVVRVNPEDNASALEGRGRLHTELLVLQSIGVDTVALSSSGRLAGRFFVDALLPLALIILVSLFTRAPSRERIDQFFGKMKTPVGATPELEAAAMDETVRHPGRFNQTKLLSTNSSWEFTRWDRVDTLGFLISCAVTLGIIGLLWALLQAVAP